MRRPFPVPIPVDHLFAMIQLDATETLTASSYLGTPHQQAPSTRRKCPGIVIGDGEMLFADSLASALHPDYKVLNCEPTIEGLVKSVSARRPDVVILGDCGLQAREPSALEELVAAASGSPIVLLVLPHDLPHAQQALTAGVGSIASRDSTLQDLKLAIASGLEGTRWLSPSLAIGWLEEQRVGSSVSPETGNPLTLTHRQLAVIRGFVAGKVAKEIAASLHVSRKTVEYHKYKLMNVLGIKSSAELVRFAIERGIA